MKEGYIGIPSLTAAQRASEVLKRERIWNTVIRMPILPGKSSCAFGLHLRETDLDAALEVLRSRGFRIGRVLIRDTDGRLQEWER